MLKTLTQVAADRLVAVQLAASESPQLSAAGPRFPLASAKEA